MVFSCRFREFLSVMSEKQDIVISESLAFTGFFYRILKSHETIFLVKTTLTMQFDSIW